MSHALHLVFRLVEIINEEFSCVVVVSRVS
jgi:hypothetical protein